MLGRGSSTLTAVIWEIPPTATPAPMAISNASSVIRVGRAPMRAIVQGTSVSSPDAHHSWEPTPLHLIPKRPPSGAVLFVYDLAATAASIVLSLALRFETFDVNEAVAPYLPVMLLPLFVRPAVQLAFGLYRREWRFASTRELLDIALAVLTGSLFIVGLFVLAAILEFPGTSPFPRSFFLIEPILTLVLTGGARLLFRLRLERTANRARRTSNAVRTLIYGAGEAGAAIARAAERDASLAIQVVGFLDDDPRKRGSLLLGHRVHGPIESLKAAVERAGARQLLIAMPSRAGDPIRHAVELAQGLGIEVKTIPPIRDLMTGTFRLGPPRKVNVEDLLRREPVVLDTQAIAGYLNGASVLVTGAGGSIGGELVRQIISIGPRALTVVDYHEAALWSIERDVASALPAAGARLDPVLADVRSSITMRKLIDRVRPDVVFHAAALKHVPYVEMHPAEGVLTNLIGTKNVLDACVAGSVQRFVLISTDKAVEPASVMGWTKRLAELLTIETAHATGLAYSAVRFGNVLGSSGSLIPLLERQLEDGIALTITEPDATRYFMTLNEAVSLILEAGAAAKAGEIYVLDMGDPVRIGDLVLDLLRMKGIAEETPAYVVTGLRPGEKLHERLFFDTEYASPTGYPGILRAASAVHHVRPEFRDWLEELCDAARAQDDAHVRDLLSSDAASWVAARTSPGTPA